MMASTKISPLPIWKIVVGAGVMIACGLGFKLYLQDHVALYKKRDAEVYANIIYEKRKERDQRVEST